MKYAENETVSPTIDLAELKQLKRAFEDAVAAQLAANEALVKAAKREQESVMEARRGRTRELVEGRKDE